MVILSLGKVRLAKLLTRNQKSVVLCLKRRQELQNSNQERTKRKENLKEPGTIWCVLTTFVAKLTDKWGLFVSKRKMLKSILNIKGNLKIWKLMPIFINMKMPAWSKNKLMQNCRPLMKKCLQDKQIWTTSLVSMLKLWINCRLMTKKLLL